MNTVLVYSGTQTYERLGQNVKSQQTQKVHNSIEYIDFTFLLFPPLTVQCGGGGGRMAEPFIFNDGGQFTGCKTGITQCWQGVQQAIVLDRLAEPCQPTSSKVKPYNEHI
jgi:hypothetical protein